MISSKDIVYDINKQLRDTWSEHEWKHGKDVVVDKGWAGRLKFITERYINAGWVVKKRVEISSTKERIFFLNFINPLSFKNCPTEIRDTGVTPA